MERERVSAGKAIQLGPWEGRSDAGGAGMDIPYECLPQIHCLSAT